VSEEERSYLEQLPESDRLRAIEVSAGVEKTGQICRAVSWGVGSISGVVGIGMIVHLLLDAGVRTFLAPYGWVFFLLALPSTAIPAMAKVFKQRADKVTRRSRELEKLLDPGRTSSLPPGCSEDDL
jgi:hypothetical protein